MMRDFIEAVNHRFNERWIPNGGSSLLTVADFNQGAKLVDTIA